MPRARVAGSWTHLCGISLQGSLRVAVPQGPMDLGMKLGDDPRVLPPGDHRVGSGGRTVPPGLTRGHAEYGRSDRADDAAHVDLHPHAARRVLLHPELHRPGHGSPLCPRWARARHQPVCVSVPPRPPFPQATRATVVAASTTATAVFSCPAASFASPPTSQRPSRRMWHVVSSACVGLMTRPVACPHRPRAQVHT